MFLKSSQFLEAKGSDFQAAFQEAAN